MGPFGFSGLRVAGRWGFGVLGFLGFEGFGVLGRFKGLGLCGFRMGGGGGG